MWVSPQLDLNNQYVVGTTPLSLGHVSDCRCRLWIYNVLRRCISMLISSSCACSDSFWSSCSYLLISTFIFMFASIFDDNILWDRCWRSLFLWIGLEFGLELDLSEGLICGYRNNVQHLFFLDLKHVRLFEHCFKFSGSEWKFQT